MDHLISDCFNGIGSFSEEELGLLTAHVQFRSLKKNEILLAKGEICSTVGYVIKGAIYHYSLGYDQNKKIIDLNTPSNWVLNHKSFTTQQPSEYTIETYEASTICFLTIEAIHLLIAKSQAFLQMGKILELAVSRIEFFDKNHTPDEKYLWVLEKAPEIIQKFPQTLIASFLKITPETLSRVRKRLL